MLVRRLPLDLILEIVILLPAKSVSRFKCVSKEWYNLIDSPLFIHLHLNKSLEPNSRHNRTLFCTRPLRLVYDIDQPFNCTKLYWPGDLDYYYSNADVVGSCNGLVCFKVLGRKTRRDHSQPVYCFLVCNPTTRTFKSILVSSEKEWMNGSLSYGFGYDNEHDDYKIVVTSNVWTESDRDVRICSLKTDLWSYPTSTTRVSYERKWQNQKNVIFRDKMLHYYLVSTNVGRFGVSKEYKIARFDVVSDKWADDLSLPSQLTKDLLELGELDGQLYLRVGSFSTHHIWMLQEHGSWKKMFHLPRDLKGHRLVASSKDGCNRLLLEDYQPSKDGCNRHRDLIWYDQRDNSSIPFKPFKVKQLQASLRLSVMIYIPSLVKIPGCSFTRMLGTKESPV